MKKVFLYVCAIVCTLGLTTSCNHAVTPDSMSGTYHGIMDVKVNIPGIYQGEFEQNNYVTVSKADESHVDIALNLDLVQDTNPELATWLNFGDVTARCLIGPTIGGEATLLGDATVAGKTVIVSGDYEERTLDLTFSLGIVTVEFEGTRR